MKTILVPTIDHPGMRPVLDTAVHLARSHGGYIEGFALRQWIDPVAIAAGSVVPSAPHAVADDDSRRCRIFFQSVMAELRVPLSNKTAPLLSYGWLNEVPEGEEFVGNRARVFDIAVMSRAGLGPGGLYSRAIETVLTKSGRPLILTPPSPRVEIGANILIVWNGHVEQARATAFGMSLLRQARRVTVLSGVDRAGHQASSSDLVRYLKYNEVNADAANLQSASKNAGREIVAIANETNCDLLITGRYGVRWLSGDSVTNWIAANSDVPLFVVN